MPRDCFGSEALESMIKHKQPVVSISQILSDSSKPAGCGGVDLAIFMLTAVSRQTLPIRRDSEESNYLILAVLLNSWRRGVLR